MSTSQKNNILAIKNTIILTFRMLLTLGISLFTSRIVLDALGEEDYGIYNVVAGIVVIFSFLNNTMSNATSRFLCMEIGKGNFKGVNTVYSNSLLIHTAIAIIVVLLAETIGLYILNEFLNIPKSKVHLAHIVYQLSVVSAAISIVQVPFVASVIAAEKMNFFAFIEVFCSIIKLVIAIQLYYTANDKLVIYSFLLLLCSFVTLASYFLYNKFGKDLTRKFDFSDISSSKKLLSFSGWDLFGQMGYCARTQGNSIILNHCFGPVVNAANGIALSIQGTAFMFSANIITAFRPGITKLYAQGNISDTEKMFLTALKSSVLVNIAISIPLIIEVEYILDVWLVQPPIYTQSFARLLLITNIISSYSLVSYILIQACGNIKKASFARSFTYISCPIISYLLMTQGSFAPDGVYLICLAGQLLIAILDTLIIHNSLKFSFMPIISFLVKVIICSTMTFVVSISLGYTIEGGFTRFCFTSLSSITIFVFLIYFVILDTKERSLITFKIRNCLQHF